MPHQHGQAAAYPFGHKARRGDRFRREREFAGWFGWWVGNRDTWRGAAEEFGTPSSDPWAEPGAIDGDNKD